MSPPQYSHLIKHKFDLIKTLRLTRDYHAFVLFADWLCMCVCVLCIVVCVTTGSISSCDAFLNVFQARGLRPEVICPCASSSEAMTVAIRR